MVSTQLIYGVKIHGINSGTVSGSADCLFHFIGDTTKTMISEEMTIKKEIAGIQIEICEKRIGEDFVIMLGGCVVQAVPRPSLSGDGTISVTSSVLNLTGHKDEFLCRKLAEKRCKETGKVVVCTGGVHMDHMTKEQIDSLLKSI